MSPTKRLILGWLWNLINAIIGGMATAGAAMVGGSMVGAAAFTQRQTWVMIAGAGVACAFNYVRDNRLPSIFEGTTTSVTKPP